MRFKFNARALHFWGSPKNASLLFWGRALACFSRSPLGSFILRCESMPH